jgi:hypothetical protein
MDEKLCDNENECPICLDNLNIYEHKILPCKHKFHKLCVNTWLQRNNICPLCRLPVSNKYKCRDGRNTFVKYKITINDDHILFKNWFYKDKYVYKQIKSISYNDIYFSINYYKNDTDNITNKYIFKNKYICENFFKSIQNKFYLLV